MLKRVFVILFVTIFSFSGLSFADADSKKPRVFVVPIVHIDRPITLDYVDMLAAKLDVFKNRGVRDILIVMRSGGGDPVAADELANFLVRYQEEGVRVKMYLRFAASAAYYIASSVKPILANKNAMVGSIGVILLKDDGSGSSKEVFLRGKYKGALFPFVKTTQDMKDYLHSSILSPAYNNFVESVANMRRVPVDKIRKFADGKIYIASIPEIKGVLVDDITDLASLKRKMALEISRLTGFSPDKVFFIDYRSPTRLSSKGNKGEGGMPFEGFVLNY